MMDPNVIVSRSIAAANSISSLREQRSIERQNRGWHTAIRQDRIQVGQDQYLLSAFAEARLEILSYKGKYYRRTTPEGSWLLRDDMILGTGGSTDSLRAGSGSLANPDFAIEIYQLPYDLVESQRWALHERLRDEATGRTIVHITTEFSQGGVDEDADRFDSGSPSSDLSRQASGKLELWIDETTFFIHRFASDRMFFENGELVQRVYESGEFDHFNEAALPGPLPPS
jgi:hypothetical protein